MVQIIVTLGPASWTESDLFKMKEKGVDFVRINMSHSSLDDLRRTIRLAKKVAIPFIVDTEGSQIRTGRLKAWRIAYEVGDVVQIFAKPVVGDRTRLSLTPSFVVTELLPGDILYCDFDSLALCVSDISSFAKKGFVTARVIAGGTLGSDKGVFLDAGGRNIELPTLTPKDHESIRIGLKEKVGHIAASFMRSKEAVQYVRKITKGKMKIISKIECIDGLRNLDGIIDASDMLLIDRGDLSKEISLERIPLTQKIIVHRARRKNKKVIVATNFLESMITHSRPTRAEIHDIESSITDGAAGLTLAAETAIGKYPLECITAMRRVISHITSVIDVRSWSKKEDELVAYLEKEDYLSNLNKYSPLVAPHGGALVSRFVPNQFPKKINRSSSILVNEIEEMDVEQIALGVYSPLEGFMSKKELESVLTTMRLPSGVVWPLPITLTVSHAQAKNLKKGQKVYLKNKKGKIFGAIHLEDVFSYDKKRYAEKLYGTVDVEHPGVKAVMQMNDIFLAGPVDLYMRREGETKGFEYTPEQARRLFEHMGWSKVIGFHTRNVIHRAHEYLQLAALDIVGADGLFVHPVVGKKKIGDFNAKYIARSYEIMTVKFYPKDKVVFGTYATYSRYAGPREALFTALCRQNFGCSHFIVGRDHTGVGDYYHPKASHKIFDQFPDIKIKPIFFDKVFYSKKLKRHVHESDKRSDHSEKERMDISGGQARKILESGGLLPSWFMRTEISEMILDAMQRGEEVFVSENNL